MPHAAGLRRLIVPDPVLDVEVPVLTLYPSTGDAVPVALGPFEMTVAVESPVRDGRHPLVVISHGSGGNPMAYRTLAHYLARRGCIVALPEHPHNHRLDNRFGGTIDNLRHRPRTLTAVIDHLCATSGLSPHINADTIALIGHSVGAYTALTVAGAIPVLPDGERLDVGGYPRVKALVLLAPDGIAGLFEPETAFERVTAAVLALAGEKDDLTPATHLAVLERAFSGSGRFQGRVVSGANHFSFLSPFPESIAARVGVAASDPEGFDRVAFHRELEVEVREFLEAAW